MTATRTRVKIAELLCGFCAAGNHATCPGAVRVPTQPAPIRCRCHCTYRCLDCGTRYPGPSALTEVWTCRDYQGCLDTQAARSAANPQAAQLADCREQSRRQRAEARVVRITKKATMAQLQAMVDAPAKPIVMSRTAPKGCLCCGEPTSGGRFRAGHDARYLGQLQRAVLAGELTLQAALDKLPTPALQDKLTRRLVKP